MATLLICSGVDAGRSLVLGSGEFIIGRGGSSHIKLPSTQISREHCVLTSIGGTVGIRDLGSANGTVINGDRIADYRELDIGDRVLIGPLELELTEKGAVTIAADSDSPIPEDYPTDVPDLDSDDDAQSTATDANDDSISEWLTVDEPQPAAESPTSTDSAGNTAEFVPAPPRYVFPEPSRESFDSISEEGDDVLRRWSERVQT